MTPAQCKAARGLLGWGRHKLAVRSQVPVHAIREFEKTGIMQRPYSMMPQIDRVAALRALIEASGIEFTEPNGGGPGVRLRQPQT